MPDPNKHAALEALRFKLRACGTCLHWRRQNPGSDWGYCQKAPHEHTKHTGERLSGTPIFGSCEEGYEPAPERTAYLIGNDYAERYL